MTLPKSERLVRNKEIAQALKSRVAVYLPLFHARVLFSAPSTHRFLVVVSKKISKRAVIRNKIKRRITAIIKPIGMLYFVDPVDIVIIVAKPAVAVFPHGDLQRALCDLMQQLAQKSSIVRKPKV